MKRDAASAAVWKRVIDTACSAFRWYTLLAAGGREERHSGQAAAAVAANPASALFVQTYCAVWMRGNVCVFVLVIRGAAGLKTNSIERDPTRWWVEKPWLCPVT